MLIFSILLTLLLLCILATVHEWGHFIASRAVGIAVKEFAIGFGPKLFGWKDGKGTSFVLRALPLGGYCMYYDDEEGEERAYARQAVWKRIVSVLAGPVMNFVLAFVVAVAFYWIGGIEQVTGYDPFISDVMVAGPAQEAGILPGDVIVNIDGQDMLDGTTDTLLSTIADFSENRAPLSVEIRRGEETVHTDITPRWNEEDKAWRIGVTISATLRTQTVPCSFTQAAVNAWDWCIYAGGAILRAFGEIFTSPDGYQNLSGPVGVVNAVGQEVTSYGLEGFISLLMVISVNLGIFNLFPIPGLDGSRLIFMLIEAIRRKPLPAEKEAVVHLTGYALLIAVMIFATFQDVIRLMVK